METVQAIESEKPSAARRVAKSALRILGMLLLIAAVLVGVMLVIGVIATREEDARRRKIHALQVKLIRVDFVEAVFNLHEMRAKYGRLLPTTEAFHGKALQKARSLYMKECQKCADAERCERDRIIIMRGEASLDYSPCQTN